MRYIHRIVKLRERFSREAIDGFLITNEKNLFYLTGLLVTGSAAIVTPEKNYLITTFIYQEEANGHGLFETIVMADGLDRSIARICRAKGIKRLGFESESLSFKNFQSIYRALGQRKMVPLVGWVEKIRLIKDMDEISLIRKSAKIAVESLKYAKKILKPGQTEKKVAAEIEGFMKDNGAVAPSFGSIVASGPHSSKPHAHLTDREIGIAEPVVVDIGANFMGYKSDLTRTLFIGKISNSIGRIYRVVKEAQAIAISRVKPGVKIRDVDLGARNHIERCGFGKYFGHAAGHGIGLDVHEGPRVWQKSSLALKEGMVFTVEPAVYIPKKFGIRIEDMVVVTANGCEVLTDDIDK